VTGDRRADDDGGRRRRHEGEHDWLRQSWLPLPALVVVTPAGHRRHHDADGGAVNLGAALTCWDRFAGTWDPRPARDGVPAEVGSSNPLAVELAGWRLLAAAARPERAWGFALQRPARLDCGD
jgi:hypothetical protein